MTRGVRPGVVYQQAEERARTALEAYGGDPRDPKAWERVGALIRHRDPRAASVAYHLAAREAGSLRDWEEGERLARISVEIPAVFLTASYVERREAKKRRRGIRAEVDAMFRRPSKVPPPT